MFSFQEAMKNFDNPAEPVETASAKLEEETGLVQVDPLSLEVVKKALTKQVEPLATLLAQADTIEVESEGQEHEATALAGAIKKLAKALEDERKRITGPALEFKRGVDGMVNGYADRLARAESEIKRKIMTFRGAQEVERRKKEAAARQAMAEAQAKLDAEASAAGVASVELPAPIVPPAPSVTRTESGSSHGQKTWAFEVIDPQQVPGKYKIVDEKAIRRDVRAGVREIPGVKIFQEEKLVIRS
ncbi:MAG: hypothetical protein KQJ78_19555 [Deltaproteobacteria bacterium]|nr:hypothetical protein [Deltaproteobacteria bacterium]